MTRWNVKYDNKKQRENRIKVQEGKGRRMLHDNFDPDWKRGDEIHGTMVFTDEEPAVAPPERDLEAEIDDMKARLQIVEDKVLLAVQK